jgi:hypothetical protein
MGAGLGYILGNVAIPFIGGFPCAIIGGTAGLLTYNL